ncbi:hypothetical protein DVJ83_17185 (plasmid) [Deinococcus wulumuqiensis]|uniref:Uncharacterized protein n=1 Tax=Deinococcus wulumuqiensis TaxID=980427 RepID=A0A345IMD1_9DEIO|nr:hypothetical protein [Deinococcus wulumuqiensis]AXH00854.1 hypothetical protein DVJ83_17185 [Deinococcus wulumuqiensis]
MSESGSPRRRFPLWMQGLVAVLVFFVSQYLTVFVQERGIREARQEAAGQRAVVVLQGQGAPVKLEGLNAACLEVVMQRSRGEEVWLRVEDRAVLLGSVGSYQVRSGDLTPPRDARVCQRLRGLEGEL